MLKFSCPVTRLTRTLAEHVDRIPLIFFGLILAMVVFAVYLEILISGVVFAAAGRVVLGCFPGDHATKNNLLVVLVFSFVGAGMFFVLVFLIARVLNISLNVRDENTLTYISWMIGGLIGGAIAAWRMTRPRPPRKAISRQ